MPSNQLVLVRGIITPSGTGGVLYYNNEKQCDTLERPYLLYPEGHEKENLTVNNKSCIEIGSYGIDIRTVGSFATRYQFKYNHKGSIQITGTGHRKTILAHIGNYVKNSQGCVLLGMNLTFNNGKFFNGNSATALKKIYNLIISENIKTLDIVWINSDTNSDEDEPITDRSNI